MLKKLVLASVTLVATTGIAFAGNCYDGDGSNCTPSHNQGPYLGFSIGSRTNYNSTPSVFNALDGTLSGGYSAMLDPFFYLAGEVFVGDSIKLNNYDGAAVDGVQSNLNFGIAIIPGYMITNTVMAYLRVGAIKTYFQDVGGGTTGWQAGLGGQTSLARNWDMRVEYVYSQAATSNSHIGMPRTNQVNLGVIYRFY